MTEQAMQDGAAAVCDMTLPDPALRPRRKDAVSVRDEPEEDGTRVLYDGERENVFMINDIGRVVLGLCDGTRTIAAIIDDIRDRYEVPADVALEDAIPTFLLVLHRANVVALE